MTIFLFSFALATVALAEEPAPSSVGQPQAVDQCGNISPQRARECVARRIAAKEKRVDRLYTQAFTAVETSHKRYGNWDNRTDPKFLKQSQVEWKRFIEDDCTVKGAFGGGSNSAISDRVAACYEDALDHRLEFLHLLATGTYGQ